MKNQVSRRHNPQSGNIFFWIFIMIVLFGALSWAMSQGSRSGSNTISSENAKLAAAEILDVGKKMRDAVQQLRINGCSDTEISFEGEPSTGYNYVNPLSPGPQCRVFHPNGAGFSTSKPSVGRVGWAMIGVHCYEGLGSSNICDPTTTELELNLIDIPDQVCIEINKIAGIGVAGAAPPLENYTNWINQWGIGSPFIGTYTGVNNVTWKIEGIGASGKTFGCYEDALGSSAGENIFYYILIAR